MKFPLSRMDKGQALVELTVVLPVLILFLSTLVPMIHLGKASLWLDERLALRQLGQPDDSIHNVLLRTHDADQFPLYFAESDLEETGRLQDTKIFTPLPGATFPGHLRQVISAVDLSLEDGWNRQVLGEAPTHNLHIKRSLTLLQEESITEPDIPARVRKLMPLGMASGVTRVLERWGFDLFHLNLEAMPHTDEKGGTE